MVGGDNSGAYGGPTSKPLFAAQGALCSAGWLFLLAARRRFIPIPYQLTTPFVADICLLQGAGRASASGASSGYSCCVYRRRHLQPLPAAPLAGARARARCLPATPHPREDPCHQLKPPVHALGWSIYLMQRPISPCFFRQSDLDNRAATPPVIIRAQRLTCLWPASRRPSQPTCRAAGVVARCRVPNDFLSAVTLKAPSIADAAMRTC